MLSKHKNLENIITVFSRFYNLLKLFPREVSSNQKCRFYAAFRLIYFIKCGLLVLNYACCHTHYERSFSMSNQHKHPTISFRISNAERKQIEARILASGMMKKDYFIRSCIYNRICVVGNKETIYPLVQTVNALYLQLLEMQKAFIKCCEEQTLSHLPNSDEIKELQTDYNNMLTAIIDLLDGAKYLWEGEHHEQ